MKLVRLGFAGAGSGRAGRLVPALRRHIRWPDDGRALALRLRQPAPAFIDPALVQLELVLDGVSEASVSEWCGVVAGAVTHLHHEARCVGSTVQEAPEGLPQWTGPVALELLSPVRFPVSTARPEHFWELAAARLEEIGRPELIPGLERAAAETGGAHLIPRQHGQVPSRGFQHHGRIWLAGVPAKAEAPLAVLGHAGVGTGTLLGLGHVTVRPGARTRRTPPVGGPGRRPAPG